ncbi:MAG: hypothetical protein LUG99_18775 [Lachnospiraceae bacterium]|nr:hypothetical protein [Lachnospiraceae bacterium]
MKRACLRMIPILLVPALGLLTGSALPKLLDMGSGSYAGLASEYAFQVYKNTETDGWDLFFYVASVRLRTLLLLWMSSFSTLGMLFHLGYAWWIAASGAMLLSLFGRQNGFWGIVLFGCCIFPQWMLYGILWKREVGFWMRRTPAAPGEDSGFEAILEPERFAKAHCPIWKLQRRDLTEFGSLALLCLSGCACEAFLGTWTLRLYLQL